MQHGLFLSYNAHVKLGYTATRQNILEELQGLFNEGGYDVGDMPPDYTQPLPLLQRLPLSQKSVADHYFPDADEGLSSGLANPANIRSLVIPNEANNYGRCNIPDALMPKISDEQLYKFIDSEIEDIFKQKTIDSEFELTAAGSATQKPNLIMEMIDDYRKKLELEQKLISRLGKKVAKKLMTHSAFKAALCSRGKPGIEIAALWTAAQGH